MTNHRVFLLTLVFLSVAALLIARLFWVQVIIGGELREVAKVQRQREYVEPARRGEIVDRDGKQLAYTMQARSLTVSPKQLREELRQQQELQMRIDGVPKADIDAQLDARVEDVLRTMANEIPGMIGGETDPQPTGTDTEQLRTVGSVSAKEILDKLHADTSYEVLVRNVDPDVAAKVAAKFHGVAADQQDIRQYPNGAVGENIIGKVSMDGHGQFGLEASSDAVLTGIDGRSTEDVSGGGQSIPGSLRDVVPAVPGARIELTVDLDLQTYVQQVLEQAKANSLAKSAEAVVLDAHTGEVLAMANTDTINPNGDIEKQIKQGKDFENPAISHPFEPGSVAKVIAAAASIDQGVTDPFEVHQVPGSIDMAGVTVSDAWQHDVLPYTTAGIFGKSSNVGTLQLAQRLGEERYWDYLNRFGIGAPTGIELPNESPGLLPVLEQWSGGTFANLPIGQGMSWTALQMASVYQALANDGERIQPRIIERIVGPDGQDIPQDEPQRNQVVSKEAARTTVDMFRAAFQEDPTGNQSGTAQGNALEGYQFSGKTGTAQKVNPETGAYSQSQYWITFAGIAPANDPRFVVAVMLDEPQRGVLDGGAGGQSAAPVFRQIASWMLDKENIPPSPPAEPFVLQAQ
ncbi:cell division protein FtsI [Corynebacterium sp. HMSC08F01]|uniref:peptidoglycan D,D-transpeptidase FtsI family protein n=1 Tax=uncultured Corynebacterium sp. TaxID=159447 RepID=UPI0008A46B17|nr:MULTISPECIES: penicillin-binding protein 2 [Corynebacterium]MDK8798482.1 penicillin-binding protein 2 [Corynebacterium coyleae]OFO36377.1 cell division protein FtsI [Corynebacterium sp. HMSC075D04]OFT29274.1 cell division protein FtsI [Corynebacterium sp. HMSC08F01]OFT70302.1 cell division protein FtsI [Corynebacterium sp. HMSC05C01]OHO32413.1 cell division protein FtsI [Corynebacterium sp. HMSC034B08]